MEEAEEKVEKAKEKVGEEEEEYWPSLCAKTRAHIP